ncbi:MAG: transposase [Planctomycetota bacterium]|nr:transposase [Planctomycetota bacterium]
MAVKFPFTSRRWALPVLAASCTARKNSTSPKGRQHKTPLDLARQLMAVLIHWFPERKFVFLGDGGYASHELARFCRRYSRHATLVSRFRGDANLYARPPKRTRQMGRPRVKG